MYLSDPQLRQSNLITISAFRKRGGSVDNLLDDLDGDLDQHLSAESKKKSISTKNLSSSNVEEVKITTV